MIDMPLTRQNVRTADEIVEILVKEKCTVSQAELILLNVSKFIRTCSTVQRVNYQERFKDDILERQE